MRVSVRFAWYDMRIGVYWNRANRALYVCPIPMVAVKIAFREPALVTSRDDLEETFGRPDRRRIPVSVDFVEVDVSHYVSPGEDSGKGGA